MKHLLILLIAFLTFIASAAEEHPLLPADISSPRATLQSFMENCEVAYTLLTEQGRNFKDEKSHDQVQDAIRGVQRCLNVSDIAEFRRDNITKEAAVALKEVLDRIELPRTSKIPDRKMMLDDEGNLIRRWTIPNTEITFELVEEGRFEGSYQFSQDTVTRASSFYQRVKNMPYKKGATEGFADTYLTTPGNPWLEQVVLRLPSPMRERVNGQAVWQWIGIIAVLLAAALLMALLYATGRRVSRKASEGKLIKYTLGLLFPIAAVFIPAKASSIIATDLVVSGQALYVIKFNLSLITLFASMVVVLGIGRRVGEIIASIPHIKANKIDAQLARLMSRIIGMIAAMVLLMQGGQHLGIPLSSLIAGAGVVGAALALSAQDVLKNIFGSIMIILDKPYTVGERIKIKNYDGVIEEVGLRSTKIRLLNGHQAIIPNEDMARSDIENIGRRPFIRRASAIRLPVDIDAEKAEKAVQLIEGLLEDHEGMNIAFPPRVWLNDFEDDHLELKIIYWYHPPDYWKFTKHADWVNREILTRFEEAGIPIALPSFITKVEDESGTPVVLPQS
ncbi:mechanosensitive ion channel family protein [Pontiellaceae bacterium B1224]|nr:mechanosensitive ion channel family protein [Pontiellaceae bacterium B1224]